MTKKLLLLTAPDGHRLYLHPNNVEQVERVGRMIEDDGHRSYVYTVSGRREPITESAEHAARLLAEALGLPVMPEPESSPKPLPSGRGPQPVAPPADRDIELPAHVVDLSSHYPYTNNRGRKVMLGTIVFLPEAIDGRGAPMWAKGYYSSELVFYGEPLTGKGQVEDDHPPVVIVRRHDDGTLYCPAPSWAFIGAPPGVVSSHPGPPATLPPRGRK